MRTPPAPHLPFVNKAFFLLFLCCLCLVLSPAPALARGNAPAGSLHVILDDLKPLAGTLYVSVCVEAEFLTENCTYTKKLAVKTYHATVVFKGLPKGTYAIQVHHDLNDNAKMDYNWLGIPEEPFGFSHITSIAGRPSFADASINYDNEEMTVAVKLLRLSGL